MDDDDSTSIVEGLAVALESIEDHAEEYTDPALAAWIESVSEQMLALQTFLTENYTE